MKKKLLLLITVLLLNNGCKQEEIPTNPNLTSLGDNLYLHKSDVAVEYRATAAEFSNWNSEKGDENGLIKKIYAKFTDNFDYVFIILNNPDIPKTIGYYGQFSTIKNDIKGTGVSIFDNSASYGSAGKLKGRMIFSANDFIKSGPSLHEICHAYANFILPTFSVGSTGSQIDYYAHWGFSDAGGQLGGFKSEFVTTNLDGVANKYQAGFKGLGEGFGVNANGGNGLPYSKIELYLMGLIPKTEVPNLKVYSGLSIPSGETRKGVFMATNVKTYTIADIVAKNGERVPNYLNSQKEFRVLSVVVSDHETTETEWQTINTDIEWFAKPSDDGTYLYNFWEATGGRATIKMGELKSSLKK